MPLVLQHTVSMSVILHPFPVQMLTTIIIILQVEILAITMVVLELH